MVHDPQMFRTLERVTKINQIIIDTKNTYVFEGIWAASEISILLWPTGRLGLKVSMLQTLMQIIADVYCDKTGSRSWHYIINCIFNWRIRPFWIWYSRIARSLYRKRKKNKITLFLLMQKWAIYRALCIIKIQKITEDTGHL